MVFHLECISHLNLFHYVVNLLKYSFNTFKAFPTYLLFNSFLLHLFVYVCVCTYSIVDRTIWVLVLPSHHVGPETRTQVVRLGGRYLYLLSHLTGPKIPPF